MRDRRRNSDRYRLGNLVLYRENIGKLAVIALGPNMLSGLRLDQLYSDADAIDGLAQAAFENITHAQIAADLLHVDDTVLVGERRIAGDDEQGRIARQCGDHVLGNPVREELLIRVATHI